MSGRVGGEIEFQSEPGDTRFEVRLPIKRAAIGLRACPAHGKFGIL